jgi:hypothetical protein
MKIATLLLGIFYLGGLGFWVLGRLDAFLHANRFRRIGMKKKNANSPCTGEITISEITPLGSDDNPVAVFKQIVR